MPIDIIVAGLGKSVQDFASVAHNYITIGVNDIDKYFAPTHLLILDPSRRFSDSRRKTICYTGASVIWTTPDWLCFKDDPRNHKITTVRFDNKENHDIDKNIYNLRTSPFVGIGLAYKLGAERIGLIGIDLLSDHKMNKFEKNINEGLKKLAKLLLEKGTILVNLSRIAKLYTIPTAPLSYMEERGYDIP